VDVGIDVGNALASAQAQLREAAEHGVAFGALRYLSSPIMCEGSSGKRLFTRSHRPNPAHTSNSTPAACTAGSMWPRSNTPGNKS
jgi:hypothetical protein